MPNIDTSKVKVIAGEMIDINNRYRDDFSVVEQAINRLKTDWQQPQKVSSAAFACFDEIKAKFFEPSITERRELAQFLCDAVGIGYEEAENANKKLLEGLFDIVGTTSNVVKEAVDNKTIDTSKTSSPLDLQINNRESLPYNDIGLNVGQCAGYAVSRFNYIYPNISIDCANANNLLNKNRNNSTVTVIDGGWENISKLKLPCIAITEGAPYNGVLYGHAMVIEDITFNEDGTIKDIYYSNSNAYDYNTGISSADGKFTSGIDGTVQKLSYSKFISQTSKKVHGFIIPNT